MTNTKSPRRPRRVAREPQAATPQANVIASEADDPAPITPAIESSSPIKEPTKLDIIEALLLGETGASIAEMVATTGWQQHSVRGAMAGALKKKRGLTITSEKSEGLRRYRAAKPQ